MTGIVASLGGLRGYMRARYRRLKLARLCVRCAIAPATLVYCHACKVKELKQRRQRRRMQA